MRGATLKVGDKVLVRNCSFDGPHKLHDKWSADIYVVVEQPDSRTPVFVVEPVNGGRKRTLHRNLLLPVESVREDSPEVKPDEEAVQKAPLSTRKIRAHTPSSATPKPVLHEDEAKSTLSLMEDEGESDLDDQEFDVVVTEPRAQIGTSRPCSPLCDPDSERHDGVGSPTLDVCSPDTLPPETSSRHTSPPPPTPPVPAPRRSARAKQPPSWHATGEFAMSSMDKLAELKSLLAISGVDKCIVTNAIVSLIVNI